MPVLPELKSLLFLTSIFLLNFMSRIIFGPLMPIIETDLGIDHAHAGSFFFIIYVGYFVSLIGSGFISCRIFHRNTIILSAIGLGVVLMGISLSNNLWQIRLSLLFLGLAAGLYLPSGIATLTELVSQEHWGKAIAVHELAPNISFVITPLVAELLMKYLPWKGVLMAIGGISISLGILFALAGRGGRFYGEAPNLLLLKDLFTMPVFWIMVILFSLGISGSLGIYTMLPLFLVVEHGMERSWANTLIALSRISGIIMGLVSGFINDRLGPKRTLMGVFLITGCFTILLGMVGGRWIPFFVFLQPLFAVCFFPPGFAALSSLTPPSSRNVAVSLTVPAAFVIGGGAVPAWIGLSGDLLSFSFGIFSVGIMILSGVLFAYHIKLGRMNTNF